MRIEPPPAGRANDLPGGSSEICGLHCPLDTSERRALVRRARASIFRLSMLSENRRLDVAAHVELTHDAHPTRIEHSRQIVQNIVGSTLVADAAIAERVDVELEALQLDHRWTRHVIYDDGGEVGIP